MSSHLLALLSALRSLRPAPRPVPARDATLAPDEEALRHAVDWAMAVSRREHGHTRIGPADVQQAAGEDFNLYISLAEAATALRRFAGGQRYGSGGGSSRTGSS